MEGDLSVPEVSNVTGQLSRVAVNINNIIICMSDNYLVVKENTNFKFTHSNCHSDKFTEQLFSFRANGNIFSNGVFICSQTNISKNVN